MAPGPAALALKVLLMARRGVVLLLVLLTQNEQDTGEQDGPALHGCRCRTMVDGYSWQAAAAERSSNAAEATAPESRA
jgi:hypothetical protein